MVAQVGQADANALRHRRPKPGDPCHLDAVFRSINGARHDLWRAVAQDGKGLARLVQPRRDQQATKPCVRKRLNGGQDVPRVLITAQLASDGAAKRELLPRVEPRQHRSLNHRAESSHQPTRPRERRLQGVKSAGPAQRFVSAYGPIAQHFRPRRHRLPASASRHVMAPRFQSWHEITGTAAASRG